MKVEQDPDARWVAALSGRTVREAETAIGEAEQERRLFGHLAREHRKGGRTSYIEIDAPLELHALARLLRPRHVLEVGVSSGVSSAYLLRALERNGAGTLHSVDLPQHPRRTRPIRGASWSLPEGRSSGWAVPSRLRSRWDLRLGDKADVVPALAHELRRVDLVLYDVPHDEADIARELADLDRRLPEGAVVIIDHGPTGGLCRALREWGRRRSAVALRRRGLRLYGIRGGPRPAGPGSRGAAPRNARPRARSA
jgi:hypothetical protein